MTFRTVAHALAALLALAGCDALDPEDAPVSLCALEGGTVVSDEGRDYCLHHDTPAWGCPDDQPVRTVYRSLALCGADAPPADRIRAIAEEGMYTGQLYARLGITAVAIGDAAPDMPIPLEVDVTYSDSAGWSYDGARSYCHTTFHHFEAHPVDDAIELTAWASQDCSPDHTLQGLEITNTHPFQLEPLPAGDYRLVFSDLYTEASSEVPLSVE